MKNVILSLKSIKAILSITFVVLALVFFQWQACEMTDITLEILDPPIEHVEMETTPIVVIGFQPDANAIHSKDK